MQKRICINCGSENIVVLIQKQIQIYAITDGEIDTSKDFINNGILEDFFCNVCFARILDGLEK